MALDSSDSYDNAAMNSLMGEDSDADDSGSESSAPAGPSAQNSSPDWPPKTFDSITIRAAKNGVVVDVIRPSSSSGKPPVPEKPHLAKSPEELSDILGEVMGTGLEDESQESPEEESTEGSEEGSDETGEGSGEMPVDNSGALQSA